MPDDVLLHSGRSVINESLNWAAEWVIGQRGRSSIMKCSIHDNISSSPIKDRQLLRKVNEPLKFPYHLRISEFITHTFGGSIKSSAREKSTSNGGISAPHTHDDM